MTEERNARKADFKKRFHSGGSFSRCVPCRAVQTSSLDRLWTMQRMPSAVHLTPSRAGARCSFIKLLKLGKTKVSRLGFLGALLLVQTRPKLDPLRRALGHLPSEQMYALPAARLGAAAV